MSKHWAQTLGAAQRAAAGKYGLSGVWQPVQGDDRLASRLLGEHGNELARVVKEALEYG